MYLVHEEELSLCGISDSDRVLIALSGGPDSVALLLEMKRLEEEGKIREIAAAHLNHGIRGNEALDDARFCRELTKKLSIPYFEEYSDVPAAALQRKMSIEEAAREIRYAFLERIRLENGFSCVATGHHADDQAETVLMHIVRGSGLEGLCGMRFRTGTVIRPLLHVGRERIRAFLAERGQTFQEDSTNAETKHLRNAVRAELIPLLERWNPQIRQAILRMSENVTEDCAFLTEVSENAYQNVISRKEIAELDPAIRMRVLKRYLPYDSFDRRDLETLDSLLTAQTGTYRNLKEGFCAWVTSDRLYAGKTEQAFSFEIPLRCGETVRVPTGTLFVETAEPESFQQDPNTAFLDRAGICGKLIARSMRPGDRFTPLGLSGSKLLSDYYTDRKVARFQRNAPLVCDEKGILYVAGHTVDERAKVTDRSERLIKIVYKEETDHVG